MKLFLGIGFAVSVYGYLAVFHRIMKTRFYFIPILTACTAGLTVYFGGLLGMLRETAYFVCIAGIVCAACDLALLQHKLPEKRTLQGFCFFCGTVVFGLLTLKLKLEHYDNFSHWALIEKYLLLTDRFPGADAEIIVFPDYPPGTAAFLYYVCRFLGTGQPVMLLAQNSMLFACFYALFGIVREHRRFLLYSFLAMGCSLLSYLNQTIRINNLLVDFLLPLLTLSSIAWTCRCGSSPRRSAVFQSIVLGFTGIVKSTGLIFAGVGCLWFFRSVIRGKETARSEKILLCICTGIGTVLPAVLWQLHMKMEFSGFENKFQILRNSGEGISRSASPEIYGEIFHAFIREATDLSERPVQMFAFFHILAFSAYLYACFRLKKRWNLLKVLLAADVMVFLYYAGILYMYLFVMPEEEAAVLAGMERYASSIMVLFLGILILCTVTDMENSFAVSIDERGPYRAYSSPAAKRRYQNGVLLTMVIAVNFLYSEINGLLSIRDGYPETLPGTAEQIIGDRWNTEDENRYLVAASDKNGQVSNWNVWYVSRYFLFAPDVTVTAELDCETVEEASGSFDYIIILDEEAVDFGGMEVYKGIEKSPGVYEVR